MQRQTEVGRLGNRVRTGVHAYAQRGATNYLGVCYSSSVSLSPFLSHKGSPYKITSIIKSSEDVEYEESSLGSPGESHDGYGWLVVPRVGWMQ
jgi:hypothetical protein